MKKQIHTLIVVLITSIGYCTAQSQQADMRLWYKQAANNRGESLALGNGRLGAVLFHGVEKELIQLTEETLWAKTQVSMGPNSLQKQVLPKVWSLLDQRKFSDAQELLDQHWFDDRGRLRQELMADMTLYFKHNKPVSNYHRQLDMRSGVSLLSYISDGVQFERESFISAVDDVMVIQLTASQAGQISFEADLSREADSPATVIAKDNRLIMRGPGGSVGSGLNFELQIQVLAEGGAVISNKETLSVEKADRVLIVINAETNFEWGKLLDLDLEALCHDKINAAFKQPYTNLRQSHINDHSQYFNRASLYLGSSTTEQRKLPTDQRVKRYKDTSNRDPELDAQIFQFQRYLLISSSRPGTQPAALHGIWAQAYGEEGHNNAYHLNINIAENYWPAEVTGLGDLQEPVADLLEKYLPNASLYAQQAFGCKGVVCGHNIDAWMSMGRTGAAKYTAQWVGGYGWMAQHLWEHYTFTGDLDYLRERALPVMRASAEFLLNYSRPDPLTGEIYIGPSASPENHFLDENTQEAATVDFGISIDQEIAHELFRRCIKAAEILEIQDDSLVQRMQEALPKLALPKIDTKGRLMEWRDERREKDPKHRHLSHLYGFHPGNRILFDKHPQQAAAVMTSLEYRLGGTEPAKYGLGRLDWQHAWMLNIWSRFRDPTRFQQCYLDYCRKFLEPNLNSIWGHRPYLMDASGAATAAIAESLLQSHAGEIHILPCLPAMWPEGSFEGFKARGGLTVDASWTKNLLEVKLTANHDGTFKLRFGNIAKDIVLKKDKTDTFTFNH